MFELDNMKLIEKNEEKKRVDKNAGLFGGSGQFLQWFNNFIYYIYIASYVSEEEQNPERIDGQLPQLIDVIPADVYKKLKKKMQDSLGWVIISDFE